jgi:hypothetical protein
MIRNAMHHLDEKIEHGKIDALESPLCLILANDSVRITSREYSYAELAARLRDLHGLAEVLAHYQQSSPGAVASSASPGP